MWYRSPLLAAALGALALAGCGSDNPALIPQEDADRLTALVGEAGAAAAAGECDAARGAVEEAELQLSGLPRRTDRELKANVRDWLQYLDSRIAEECEAPEPEETPTPEPTVAPTETPTPEPTPAETPTPTPEPTVTVEPEPDDGEEEPPVEEPPTADGVPPGDD